MTKDELAVTIPLALQYFAHNKIQFAAAIKRLHIFRRITAALIREKPRQYTTLPRLYNSRQMAAK